MQKKKQTTQPKQIILYIAIVAIVLLLTFAEDIIKLATKNKIGILESTPGATAPADPNSPHVVAGMIPVKWETDHFAITTKDDPNWYDYKNGKPAYIMLNDGYYRSEIERGVTEDQLMANVVGKDALVVPDVPDNNPTILMWIPRFAYNEEGDIQYIKDVEQAEESWTIPDVFTYAQTKETAPDFLLTGIWLEKDVDTSYASKITEMNKEDSIYGFLANTVGVGVPDDPQYKDEIQNYYDKLIANAVGNDAPVVPPITDITNPNRIILKMINQKYQAPIKAKGSYNKETALITVQVTYTQYGIEKILLDETTELTFTQDGRQATADTTGIELEDGERKITIIDKQGNTKELKIKVIGKIYATLYTDGTLAFGKSKNPLPEKTINVSYGDISEKECTSASMPWYAIRANIKKADFVNKISPISTAFWFCQCTNLATINNIKNLNTENVTSMDSMFYYCTSLSTLDVSNFDTSNVTNMTRMFDTCRGLTTLDVSNFNTSNVTNMMCMFRYCERLTSLDVSNFNTSNVTNMSYMFDSCDCLTSLDLSNFDTSNVTTMYRMICSCDSLTSLDVSNFDTSKVTTMEMMFAADKNLTSLDLGSFDTSNVTTMEYMFDGCTKLKTIYIGQNWKLASKTNNMFRNCGTSTTTIKQ